MMKERGFAVKKDETNTRTAPKQGSDLSHVAPASPPDAVEVAQRILEKHRKAFEELAK